MTISNFPLPKFVSMHRPEMAKSRFNSSFLFNLSIGTNYSFPAAALNAGSDEGGLQNMLFGILAVTLALGSLVVGILQYRKRYHPIVIPYAPKSQAPDRANHCKCL